MKSIFIFQIYYDQTSKQKLDPGFLPLDNTKNNRPDWYELWSIKNFLKTHTLEEDSWYGFLSPKFYKKTGLTSEQINTFLHESDNDATIALISYAWDQIAYFRNPFEQGEIWHPGLTHLAQAALLHLGYNVYLDELITHSGNFTFSNYIIAKPPYWRKWEVLATALFDLIEEPSTQLSRALRNLTSYGSQSNLAPMKTFIQERLPSVILSTNEFRTITLDNSATFPIFERIFNVNDTTRERLKICDSLKKKYCESKNTYFLDLYEETRKLISINKYLYL